MRIYLPVTLLSVTLLFASCGSLNHLLELNTINESFTYYQRTRPQTPLTPPFFYYHVQASVPEAYKDIIDKKAICSRVSIEGQRHTDKPLKNDVTIDISCGMMKMREVEIREGYTEEKNKRTGAIMRAPHFWVECEYNMAILAHVLTGGKKINTYILSKNLTPQIYKSKLFPSRKEALTYWNLNKEYITQDLVKDLTMSTVELLSTILGNDYGYPLLERTENLISINDKAINENNTFNSHCSALKNKLASLNGDTPLKITDLQSHIDYFKSIDQKYPDLENKSEIRIRSAAYYNLARTYLLLEKPDEADKWTTKITENGYLTDRVSGLTAQAADMRDYLRLSSIKTTQFSPDSYFKNNRK